MFLEGIMQGVEIILGWVAGVILGIGIAVLGAEYLLSDWKPKDPVKKSTKVTSKKGKK